VLVPGKSANRQNLGELAVGLSRLETTLTAPELNSSETACFEAALTQLEAVVHDLEEGQVGLAEALGRYEEGVRLLKHCYGLLRQAEQRIEVLTGIDATGQPVSEPFDAQATASLDEKGENRNQRRSRQPPARPKATPSGPRNDVDEFPGLF
jgi:exodeoxyribonuclease VII small subunit